jgi:hypothetical protein
MVFAFAAETAQAQMPKMDVNLNAGVTPVKVDCLFRQTTKISCPDFIRGFFADIQSVIVQDQSLDGAMISLTLSDDVDTGSLTKYTFSWKSKDETQVSDFETYYRVDQSTLDGDQLRDNLLRRAGAGVMMFLDVIRIKADDGVLSGAFQTPKNSTDTDRDGLFDRLQKSPLYINIGLDGTYRTTGQAPYINKSMSVSPDVEIVYLKDRYKIDLMGYYKNTKASVPSSNGGTLTAENNARHFSSIVVYTMKRRWSVAVMDNVGMDSAANTKFSNVAVAGLEWALVPFRTNQNKELSFRVGTTHNTLDLNLANERGNFAESYFGAFARVYAYWIFLENKATLKLNGGYEKNLKYSGYEKYNIGGSLNFQVNRSTKLNFIGAYNFVTKSLTYPGVPDFTNPIMVQQMTGQSGKSLYMSVGIDVTIGNSLRKSRDRRWATDPMNRF